MDGTESDNGKCWNGEEDDWTDLADGMARQIGNDLSELGAFAASLESGYSRFWGVRWCGRYLRSYVRNAPLSFIDPSGFMDLEGTLTVGCADPFAIQVQYGSDPENVGCVSPAIFGGILGSDSGSFDTRGSGGTVIEGVMSVATQVPSTKGETQDDDNVKCWNASLGVGLTAAVFLGGGGGLSPAGISYEGSLLDTRFFMQAQAYGLIGAGIFGGVGLNGQYSGNSIGRGLSIANGVHGEIDVGTGLVSGSITGDWYSSGDKSVGGYEQRLPGGRLGVGGGLYFGLGVTTQSTYGFSTPRELWNDLAAILGLPQSLAETCSN